MRGKSEFLRQEKAIGDNLQKGTGKTGYGQDYLGREKDMEKILNLLTLDETEKRAFEKLMRSDEMKFFPENVITPEKEDYEQATAILGNPPTEALKYCKKLKLLHTRSAGTDEYEVPGVLPEGVILKNSSGAYGHSVSEHMFAMLLSSMKRLSSYRDQQQEGQWKDLGPVKTLQEARVLFVGTGDLGGALARMCKAFGSYNIGVRRDPQKSTEGIDEMYPLGWLDQFLPEVDIVALTLPGGPATANIMNRERLFRMKKDAILLNGGRGTTVDCNALADVMAQGHLWGACLDVTDPEPLPKEHPLWKQPRAVITPHSAGGYHLAETPHLIAQIVLKNLQQYLKESNG